MTQPSPDHQRLRERLQKLADELERTTGGTMLGLHTAAAEGFRDALSKIETLEAEVASLRSDNDRLRTGLSGSDRKCIVLHSPYCVELMGDTNCQCASFGRLERIEAANETLEQLVREQDKLLACYRIGKNPGSIIDRITKLKKRRAALAAALQEEAR